MANAAAITLARHFDNRAWRAAEKTASWPRELYQKAQERHPGLVERWDSASRNAQIPAEAKQACLGEIDALSPAQRLTAFAHAVAAGAHLVAEPLVEAVLADPGAIAPLRAHWLAIGQTDRAAQWQHQHAAFFAYSGALDPLLLAQEIDAGRVDAGQIAALLCTHRRELLLNPELHLLARRSLLPLSARDARDALNRYLRTQGSDRVEASALGGHYLRDVRFAPAQPVSGGPRVSVLISAYDSEATIEYALASVLGQSYRNLEVLLCDDASRDNTLQRVQERFAGDSRLRLFRSKANQGTYNVRNALIAEASGDLITVHDADDISLPRRIELQVAQLSSGNKKASVTNFLRVVPDGRMVFFHDRRACRMAIVSLMASREVFAAMGPYRGAKFGADFEFLERLKHRYGAASVARIRSPQLFCLWSDASVTRSAESEALASGYRSPARRAYSDLVYRERVLGRALEVDAEVQSILRPAADIEPV